VDLKSFQDIDDDRAVIPQNCVTDDDHKQGDQEGSGFKANPNRENLYGFALPRPLYVLNVGAIAIGPMDILAIQFGPR